MSGPKRLRCAIYTRKSSEEGLEQRFNSLHAQREACEAYVLSQVGEGWIALSTIYDDGGFSGGTMDRPRLTQLLADIELGKIDIVVVYKVDRLTRALSDFARIVEIFDKQGVSFVSVTQAFNTTSSMGRLTLNVLLSFAQFEREVTGERIRDKVAASKAKGLWMGGGVPLGYDIPDTNNRVLKINPVEAETVRFIFQRYLELGTVRKLAEDLRLRSVTTKARVSANSGRHMGGAPWKEGHLHFFLKNPVYAGDIVHKDKIYPGQHKAIIDRKTFDAVQAQFRANRIERQSNPRSKIRSALTGKIFDDAGHPMSPVSARKGGRLHRYYVSAALLRSDRGSPGSVPRIPAEPAEALVERELKLRADPARIADDVWAPLIKLVASKHGVEMILAPELLRPDEGWDNTDTPLSLHIPVVLKTFGGSKQLIDMDGAPVQVVGPDLSLQKAIARGRRWVQQLETGERSGADDIAAIENLQSRYVDKVMRLAWLAPDITEAILAGKRLRHYSVTELLTADLPADWAQQRMMLELV